MAQNQGMRFSYSMLSSWRRCRFRWYLQYIEGYITPTSLGQARGTCGHTALAYWYMRAKRGKKAGQRAIGVAWDKWQSIWEDDGPDPKEFALLEEALTRYFDWAKANDDWNMVTAEFHFDNPLGEFRLQGYIDGIVRKQDHVWLLENKFQKQARTAHLDLDAQVGVYMIGASLSGYKPVGVIYNIVRIGSGPTALKCPVERRFLYRSAEGLNAKIQEIHSQMKEMDQFKRQGGEIYRNETQNCNWDCGFYNVCLAMNEAGDVGDTLKGYEVRPFEERRKDGKKKSKNKK